MILVNTYNKIIMKRYIYSSDALITSKKNIKVYITNFVFMLFIGIIINFLGAFYMSNSDYYNKNNEIVNVQIEKMLQMTEEANLSDKDKDGNLLELNDMYKKYAIGHILLSYELNEDEFNNLGYYDLKVEGYYKINIEEDYLANFYFNYLPSLDNNPLDYNGLSNSEYYKKVLNDLNKDLSMFNLDEEYPSLKTSFAIELYKYIVLENKMDNQAGLDANTLFADIFTKTFNYNSQVFQSLDFYSIEFDIYNEAYQNLVDSINLVFVMCYVITFTLLFILIPLFNRGHLTLGEILSGVVVCSYYEENAKWWQFIIRGVIHFILYFPVLFFICFLLGGTNAITSNIFIGNFHFTLLGVIGITLLIYIVNIFVSTIRKDKRTLIELLSNTMCLDCNELKVVED